MSGEEHAGPSPSGSLHHRPARGVLHGAVDRRIRIPEPDQVSGSKKTHTRITNLSGFNAFFTLFRARGAVEVWVHLSSKFVFIIVLLIFLINNFIIFLV